MLPLTMLRHRVTFTTVLSRKFSIRTVGGLSPADIQLKRDRPMHSYGVARVASMVAENDSIAGDLAYCLSFAPNDACVTLAQQLTHHAAGISSISTTKNSLQNHNTTSVQKLPVEGVDERPLPETVEDALRPSRRAIVITEAQVPFKIWDVNRAWEELCGYSYMESKGKTLGSLLHGPETNKLFATNLITQVLNGEKAGTTLINYTKAGRRFRNRIRVGPLRNEHGEITHFVGVLKEVDDGK